MLNDTLEHDFIHGQEAGSLRIYSLAVGQGDCTILVCPANNDLFILDMGSVSSSGNHALTKNDIQDLLKDYIKQHSKARINIAVTHADNDHYNWLSFVFSDKNLQGQVDHFILGGIKNDYDSGFITWANGAFTLSDINKGKHCYGNADCTVVQNMYSKSKPPKNDFPQFCSRTTNSDVEFEALTANMPGTKNSESLVTKITFKKFSLLLPGDFETKSAQEELVDYYDGTTKLNAGVYKLAHHGAEKEANFEDFLEAIDPKMAFTSQAAPDTGTYHHPRCDAVNRLMKVGSINDLEYSLPYDFTCYDTKAADTVALTKWNKKDLHMTCPGDEDQPSGAPYCSTLKIDTDGTDAYGEIYYIPVV